METKKKEIQKLEKTVKVYGVGIPKLTAKLIKRTEKKRGIDKAIYFRWDGVYEVFKIKIKIEDGMKIEQYPSNEDFGNIAWCFNKLDLAEQCYNKI